MIYNKYGNTNIMVSAIGMGGMRFQNQDDIQANAQIVKAAYDKGINYFDTAPGYGRSEEIYGQAFKQMKKTRSEKPFYAATKSMEKTPDGVKKDLHTSLERLNLDYIDFFHLWCVITLEEYAERKKIGVLKELEKLKEQGLIRHICVSTHLPGDDIAKLLSDFPFDGVLLGYSAMNFPFREKGIQAAADSNIAVAVMNPLGGGIIPNHPDIFDFLRSTPDETVNEAALRFLINDKRITTALVGFSSLEHVDEAVSAVDGFTAIDDERIAQIKNSLNENFNELCTGCRYCDICPEDIPVPKLMDAYNHKLLDPSEPITQYLSMYWSIKPDNNILYACTECGKCEQACTQHLPVRERIKQIAQEANASLKKNKKPKPD